jgi:gamma-glutamyl-gamma-aminobutyrate hydrolase PuuD
MPLVLTTGPSIYTAHIHKMIEKYFGWNYVYVTHDDPKNLTEWAEKADLYFGGGGRDIFPETYGSPLLKNENMENFDRARDKREVFLMKKFLELNKPIAGVCRNFQLYCSAFLGLNLTDINFSNSSIVHSPSASGIKLEDDEKQFCHYVNINGDDYWVNSAHHMGIILPSSQNLAKLPDSIEVVATSLLGYDNKLPKIIEWIKDTEHNVNMVQWHPEVIYEENEISQQFLEEVKALVV